WRLRRVGSMARAPGAAGRAAERQRSRVVGTAARTAPDARAEARAAIVARGRNDRHLRLLSFRQDLTDQWQAPRAERLRIGVVAIGLLLQQGSLQREQSTHGFCPIDAYETFGWRLLARRATDDRHLLLLLRFFGRLGQQTSRHGLLQLGGVVGQARLIVAAPHRAIPADMPVADRDELALVLAAERPARPAARDEPIEFALEDCARPDVPGLLQLVEPPERVLPTAFLGLETPQQAPQLLVLAVHRPDDMADPIEETGRELPHPELRRRQLGIGPFVRQPDRPIAALQLPDAGAAMRSTLALDLAGLVDPFVAREPVVRHERWIPGAAVPVAERRLLPAHAVVLIPVALAAALAERD